MVPEKYLVGSDEKLITSEERLTVFVVTRPTSDKDWSSHDNGLILRDKSWAASDRL